MSSLPLSSRVLSVDQHIDCLASVLSDVKRLVGREFPISKSNLLSRVSPPGRPTGVADHSSRLITAARIGNLFVSPFLSPTSTMILTLFLVTRRNFFRGLGKNEGNS